MTQKQKKRKVLVIGSGPIVIGQAAEFDYAGTQACLALQEEGIEVLLCNSNPATIMTDTQVADKIYMEPLTLEFLAKIIRKERPDALLPGIGGQTGLNLAMQLEKKGVLRECSCELLGTGSSSIALAEDREQFKNLMEILGEPVLPSFTATTKEEGLRAAASIGYPLVLRPAYTLGGTGGGFAYTQEEFLPLLESALSLSPVKEVLIEKSVKGYREIEYEVMRDKTDTAIVVANMENVDPVGIHTGDSIVVCPSQTLSNAEYQMLRSSALRIIRALGIEGGCNVQFALAPDSSNYYVIEVNPRVSRSSALASKASGYPIARVSAKIGIGMTLEEIALANTPACFEPALDYVVTKLPRFPFDKFTEASNELSTQMKATGEVMAVGRCFEESLLKGIRSLEVGARHLYLPKFEDQSEEDLLAYVRRGTDDRIFALAALLRLGCPLRSLAEATGIDLFFLGKLANIIRMEKELASWPGDLTALRESKKLGFSDWAIAWLWGWKEEEVFSLREKEAIHPVFKMIDSCASEFSSYIPYFYSSYEEENESIVSDKPKIIVLGSGPIRIGQGVEFDYSTVYAVKTIRKAGYEAILINNNPETVSTDYTCSDKLYFEPLCPEDVLHIVNLEKPVGVIATLGGQTALSLAEPLEKAGVPLIGTDCASIDLAENRDLFEKLLLSLQIPQPRGEAVSSKSAALKAAAQIGYPLLVRPSFVLGGRAMEIVSKEGDLITYLEKEASPSKERPILLDKYIRGKEVEVDAICDGKDCFLPGIMELVERTGVHSGDSISVYPPYSLTERAKEIIVAYTKKLGPALGIKGLYNIQFIVAPGDKVYCIEVNPRSSRTVPFLSKATGTPLADIGTLVMLGKSLREQGLMEELPKKPDRYFVKVPTFSISKLEGMDAYLSPEMKSTGEAIGYDKKLHRAAYKALIASGLSLKTYGTILVSVADEDKAETIPLIRRFYEMGFNIEATPLTGEVLLESGIRVQIPHKPSEGSNEVLESLQAGYVTYLINTRAILSGVHYGDGTAMRRMAAHLRVPMLTSLDTVHMVLNVLEEMTLMVSPLA